MSANEKEICKNLASELFNLVPSSNDLDITDISEGRNCMLLLSTLSCNRGFELHRSSTCVRTFIHSHTHMNTLSQQNFRKMNSVLQKSNHEFQVEELLVGYS